MKSEFETIEMETANEAVVYLNDQCWHDSVLHEIVLVRTESKDQVVLKVDLLSDWEKQISRYTELTFQKCWHVRTVMDWGVECISGGEMIYSVESSETDPLLERVRARWEKMKIDLPNLGVFRMKLSSTNSTLEIAFQGMAVKRVSRGRPHSAPPPLIAPG